MNRLIYKSLTAIGLMGLAYYLYNPKKYNRMAKAAGQSVKGSYARIAQARS